MTSWFLCDGDQVCKDCGAEIVVTQGHKEDYLYYCSNVTCIRHSLKEDLGDQEDCTFAINYSDFKSK